LPALDPEEQKLLAARSLLATLPALKEAALLEGARKAHAVALAQLAAGAPALRLDPATFWPLDVPLKASCAGAACECGGVGAAGGCKGEPQSAEEKRRVALGAGLKKVATRLADAFAGLPEGDERHSARMGQVKLPSMQSNTDCIY
jgi:hypothetical protein